MSPKSLDQLLNFKLLAVLSLFTLCWSCADPAELAEDEDAVYKLLDGERTNAFPAIGQLDLKLSDDRRGLCTGTLVAPSVVLTAAHCISYESRKKNFGKFIIKGSKSFDIDAAISFSPQGGMRPHDLALLHLKKSVSRNLARPFKIAQELPANGTPVETFGYGCQDRESREGSGKKQAFEFAYGEVTQNLCPGDSGGPVVIPQDKEIISINSAYTISTGNDIFGLPSYLNPVLTEVIQVMEDEGGSEAVQQFKNIGETAPKKPSKLKLELRADRVVRLTWEIKGEYHIYFEYQRRKQKGNGEWREPVGIGFGRKPFQSLIDTSLEKNGTYQYRMRSLNSVGESGWTNWKTIDVSLL